MNRMAAGKYHCYGNDFLILSGVRLGEKAYSDLAKAICDRHFGVGADGCIVILPGRDGGFKLRQFNADGSEFGMSGNGVRCAAAFLVRRKMVSSPRIEFETASGLKTYDLLEHAADRWKFRSSMGEPGFSAEAIPCVAPDAADRIQDFPLEVGTAVVRIDAVWVGNPQCVVFGPRLPEQEEFLNLGARLEVHPFFPERTNVSFATPEGDGKIRIRIWERGVGPTHSSGTGSCGAAVAAIRRGLAASPVEIVTETGSQLVEWQMGKEISLTGECHFIADVKFNWTP